MRYLVLAFLFFVSLVLQSTLFSHLTIAGVKPDIVLTLVIFYSIINGPREGAKAGFIGGLLQDLLFGRYIGLNAFSKLVVGYFFGILERKIFKDNFLIPAAAVFAGTFISETVIYFLRFVMQIIGIAGQIPTGFMANAKGVVFWIAIYNSILAPFLYSRFYRSSQKGMLRVPDR